jgi:hypothetical protein
VLDVYIKKKPLIDDYNFTIKKKNQIVEGLQLIDNQEGKKICL